jgi:hypothetical protein
MANGRLTVPLVHVDQENACYLQREQDEIAVVNMAVPLLYGLGARGSHGQSLAG